MTQTRESDVISGDVPELKMLVIIKVANFYVTGTVLSTPYILPILPIYYIYIYILLSVYYVVPIY